MRLRIHRGHAGDRRHLHRGGGAGQADCARCRPAARRARRGAGDAAPRGSGVPGARRQPARRHDLACPPGPLRAGRAYPPGTSGVDRRSRAQHPQGRERVGAERACLHRPAFPLRPAAGRDRPVPRHAFPRRSQRLRRLRPAGRSRRQTGLLFRRLPRAWPQGGTVRASGQRPARRHRRAADGGHDARADGHRGRLRDRVGPRRTVRGGLSADGRHALRLDLLAEHRSDRHDLPRGQEVRPRAPDRPLHGGGAGSDRAGHHPRNRTGRRSPSISRKASA